MICTFSQIAKFVLHQLRAFGLQQPLAESNYRPGDWCLVNRTCSELSPWLVGYIWNIGRSASEYDHHGCEHWYFSDEFNCILSPVAQQRWIMKNNIIGGATIHDNVQLLVRLCAPASGDCHWLHVSLDKRNRPTILWWEEHNMSLPIFLWSIFLSI